MKLYNIRSIRKKAFRITTNSNHNYAVSPNLLKRDFTADKPNQKWVGDITYIPTDEGWLYAAIVKDLCLKKIVGYSFSSRIDTSLTVSALEMAVNRQKSRGDLIFHSDRGVQYASGGYREALDKHNITQSMSRKGDPYDNAVAENFFSCLKCELVHHKHYKTKDEAQIEGIQENDVPVIAFAVDNPYHRTADFHSQLVQPLIFFYTEMLDIRLAQNHFIVAHKPEQKSKFLPYLAVGIIQERSDCTAALL